MFFKKKGRIRKEENARLFALLEEMKQQFIYKQNLVKKSVDPSPIVLNELKLTEAKYMFLLKEAKMRKLTMDEKE